MKPFGRRHVVHPEKIASRPLSNSAASFSINVKQRNSCIDGSYVRTGRSHAGTEVGAWDLDLSNLQCGAKGAVYHAWYQVGPVAVKRSVEGRPRLESGTHALRLQVHCRAVAAIDYHRFHKI